jgi:hypothetical protein
MAPSSNASLAERVTYLEDLEALRNVLHRYARGLDRGDEELMLSVYHPDAYEDHAGLFNGKAVDFVRQTIARWADRPAPIQHVLTNMNFEIDGDVAYSESYIVVRFAEPPREFGTGAFARYLDRFERRDGEWRIAYRRLVIDWDGIGGDGYDYGGARRDRTDPSYTFRDERPALPSA